VVDAFLTVVREHPEQVAPPVDVARLAAVG
jgi:hypothetical protein